jgi:hypothetical protein
MMEEASFQPARGVANIDRTSSLPNVSSSSMRAVVSTAPANFSFARCE